MKLARRIAELVGRGIIVRRTMLVKHQKVQLYVTPDAQLKYLKPGLQGFDRDLIELAERYVAPESVVWDIGANVGTFAFAAASIATHGQVVAVEADNWLANILRKSTALPSQAKGRVSILSAAVSGRPGIEKFMIAERGRASNALVAAGGRSQMGGVRDIQYVPSVTLDSMLEAFEAPSFIKIDVEGAEEVVIQGATKVLRDVRPMIYIEIGENGRNAICDRIGSFGYEPCGMDGQSIDPSVVDNVLWLPR